MMHQPRPLGKESIAFLIEVPPPLPTTLLMKEKKKKKHLQPSTSFSTSKRNRAASSPSSYYGASSSSGSSSGSSEEEDLAPRRLPQNDSSQPDSPATTTTTTTKRPFESPLTSPLSARQKPPHTESPSDVRGCPTASPSGSLSSYGTAATPAGGSALRTSSVGRLNRSPSPNPGFRRGSVSFLESPSYSTNGSDFG